MNFFLIGFIAISALAILSTLTPALLQVVNADKDCSAGMTLSPFAKQGLVGDAASSHAHQNGGNGKEFKGFNESCHSR